MKKIGFILAFLIGWMTVSAQVIGELPTASSVTGSDILVVEQTDSTRGVTKDLLQKTLRDSLIVVEDSVEVHNTRILTERSTNDTQQTAIDLNTAKVTNTDTQDLGISGNNVTLTSGGTADISSTTAVSANTAKNTNVDQTLGVSGNNITLTNGGTADVSSTTAVGLNTAKETNTDTQDLGVSGNNITLTDGGTADVSSTTAVGLNTAKATNVSTTLATGTVTATTYGISSDGASDDVVLAEANTNTAGLLGADKWDEVVANGSQLRDSLGRYIATSYGADKTGASNAAPGIQAAINAASSAGGGTVLIPSGEYLFDTSPDTLKFGVEIDVDRGAEFVAATAYSGSIWYNGAGPLEGSGVDGGRYTGDGFLWTCLKIHKETWGVTDNYAIDNRFQNMSIYGAAVGIDLNGIGSGGTEGWINGNFFYNIWIQNSKSHLKMRGTTNGNTFSNIQFEADDSTYYGIDSLQGTRNVFSPIMFWDFGGTGPASREVINLTSTSHNNKIIAGQLSTDKTQIINAGTDNDIQEGGRIVGAIGDSLLIYATSGSSDIIDKLVVGSNSPQGTAGSPAGDVGIKIRSRMPNETDYSSNTAVRIVGKNEYNDNNSGHMYLQVHENASDPSNTAYLDALYLDGSSNGDATFSNDVHVTGDLTVDGTSPMGTDLEYYNVKDYGATGDSVTSDLVAVQAAYTAAKGGTVFFPPGNYYCPGTIEISEATNTEGSGNGQWYQGGSVIRSDSDNPIFDINSGATYARVNPSKFENLRIEGSNNAAHTGQYGIKLNGPLQLYIGNVFIRRTGSHAFDLARDYHLDKVWIEKCNIQYCHGDVAYGRGQTGVKDINEVTFTECEIYDNRGHGFNIWGTKIALIDNVIQNNDSCGIYLSAEDAPTLNADVNSYLVKDNYFELNSGGDVFVQPRIVAGSGIYQYIYGLTIRNNVFINTTANIDKTEATGIITFKLDDGSDLYTEPIRGLVIEGNDYTEVGGLSFVEGGTLLNNTCKVDYGNYAASYFTNLDRPGGYGGPTKVFQGVPMGTPEYLSVVAATGISTTLLDPEIRIEQSSSVDITANPQFADGFNGQTVRLINMGANTLTLDDGNGLSCGGTIVLGQDDVIEFKYSESDDVWIRTAYMNN